MKIDGKIPLNFGIICYNSRITTVNLFRKLLMKRVVITGAGIVSCLGNDLTTVKQALMDGKSGLSFNQSYADHGFKSQVAGSIDADSLDTTGIDRKLKRFMSDASLYAYVSALAAIKDAGLTVEDVADNPRVAVVAASGGAWSGRARTGDRARTQIDQPRDDL